ncbi:hypothetical protein [Guyparkeria sp.]|uniref:hypothetical protein n=1 Tax=Guyparkeria sp. TaxID=2035736 RepID=UPI0039705077
MKPITVDTRKGPQDWALDRFSALSRLPEMLAIASPIDGGPPATDPEGAERLKNYMMDAESWLSSSMETLAVLQEVADSTTRRDVPKEFDGLASLWILLSGLSRATGDAVAALDDKAREGRG